MRGKGDARIWPKKRNEEREENRRVRKEERGGGAAPFWHMAEDAERFTKNSARIA
jgi:hypothetical protein